MLRYLKPKKQILDESRYKCIIEKIEEEVFALTGTPLEMFDGIAVYRGCNSDIVMSLDRHPKLKCNEWEELLEAKKQFVQVNFCQTLLSSIIRHVRMEIEGYNELDEYEMKSLQENRAMELILDILGQQPLTVDYEKRVDQMVKSLLYEGHDGSNCYNVMRTAILVDAYNYMRTKYVGGPKSKNVRITSDIKNSNVPSIGGSARKLSEEKYGKNAYTVAFKHVTNFRVQTEILFNKNIKNSFIPDDNKGKVFQSSKAGFEKLCELARTQKSSNGLICNKLFIADTVIIERIMGFNLALTLYENLSAVIKRKGSSKADETKELENIKSEVSPLIKLIMKLRSPMLRVYVADEMCRAVVEAYKLGIVDGENVVNRITVLLERYIYQIDTLYESVYTVFIGVLESCNHIERAKDPKTTIETFSCVRANENQAALSKTQVEDVCQLNGLDEIDKEIERLVREERLFDFMKQMKQRCSVSVSLKELEATENEKSGNERFGHKLFTLLIRNIIKENLIIN